MEEIISNLAQIRSSLGSALNELAAKQSAEASRLQELRTESETTIRQIRELHGVEVKDDSLTSIINDYQKAAEQHQKTLAEKQEAFDAELTNLRKSWEKAKEDRARALAEDNEAYNKVTERERQEYTYQIQQKRDLEKDAYEFQKKHAEADLAEFQAKKKKEWDEREKTIAEQEKQYAEAKKQVEEFPQKLEAAVKKAKEEGKGIALNQAKIEADLLAKEIEGEKRVYDLKIKSLEDTIKEHSARIATLQKQLNEAVAQAQSLAIKSIEGASNANTFGALREIALEQAKSAPKKSLPGPGQQREPQSDLAPQAAPRLLEAPQHVQAQRQVVERKQDALQRQIDVEHGTPPGLPPQRRVARLPAQPRQRQPTGGLHVQPHVAHGEGRHRLLGDRPSLPIHPQIPAGHRPHRRPPPEGVAPGKIDQQRPPHRVQPHFRLRAPPVHAPRGQLQPHVEGHRQAPRRVPREQQVPLPRVPQKPPLVHRPPEPLVGARDPQHTVLRAPGDARIVRLHLVA
jgi:hypothetical protein